MKILYLSHILSIHDFRFLEKLSSSNHDVLLVAIDNSNIPESISSIDGLNYITIPRPNLLYDYKYYLSFYSIILAIWHLFYRVIEQFGIENKLFNKKTIFSHTEFRFFFYKKKLSQIIKYFKPDILHAGWVQLDGFVAGLTGFKPVLQMPWASDILIHPFNSEQYLKHTKFVLNGATRITCDCEEVKKTILNLVDYDKDKITVFPRGVDLSLFNPKRKNTDIIDQLGWQDKRIIINTRSFGKIYGIDIFLMALPKIIKTEPEARVLLVGIGPLKDETKEIVDSLDLNEYVHFPTIPVSHDHLAYYLNSAEVYVSTSKTDGSSLSLLEAMACGLPLVVSDVPAICEWVTDGENGYLVPRNKVNPISDKVLLLLNDHDTAKRFGQINRNIAIEKADWDKNYLVLESIYKDIDENFHL
jgi:glycosyltransferase involved in cell wall biosynthesis